MEGNVTEILAKLGGQLDVMGKLVEQQGEQLKQNGQVREELGKRIDAQDKVVVELKSELEAARKRGEELELKLGRPGHSTGGDDEFLSAGAQFISSEQLKAAVDAKRYSCDRVQVKGLLSRKSRDLALALKALTSDPASAGALVAPMRLAGIVTSPERPLRLRDLLTVATTQSDSIEWPQETGFSNLYTVLTANVLATSGTLPVESTAGFYVGQTIAVGSESRVVATVVPATNTITITVGLTAGKSLGDPVTSRFFSPTAEGADKPQGGLEYALKSSPVKTIAHWIPASRQILADAGGLRAQIDGRLIYGLGLTEEEQLLYGDGTGENLQGILTHPSCQTYLWSGGTIGDTKIDAIRRAMTLARVAEYPISGIALSPEDWEDVELAKGSDGDYVWISVSNGGEARLFRVPVIDTTALRSGEAAIGAFAIGATLFDREDASVRVAEQHADFFVKNMVAVLAEQREALAIFRPEAFVKCTFDVAPS